MKKLINITVILMFIISMCVSPVKLSEAKASTENNTYGVSTRAVWHRPNVNGGETDLAGIIDVLSQFKAAGINLVFVETFYHGMSAFQSDTVEYYKSLSKHNYDGYNDYLSAFAGEAAKLGIEVHAWVENFYIGVESTGVTQFEKNNPDWLLKNSAGEIYHSSESGYKYLDPANKEVQDFLIGYYDELLAKNPLIKGINLDYIRYPVTSRSNDSGFTKAAMSGFTEKNGIILKEESITEFLKLFNTTEYGNADANYAAWVNYRADKVTEFVGRVFNEVRQKYTETTLSTAVFTNASQAYQDKKQDYTEWFARGYIDIATPMAYYDNTSQVKNAVETMVGDTPYCYCYAGLSSVYHKLPAQSTVAQTEASFEAGASGYVLFGSQFLLGNTTTQTALAATVNENVTADVQPHHAADKVLEAMKRSILKKAETLEITGVLNSKQKQDFVKILAEITTDSSNLSLYNALAKIELLKDYNLEPIVGANAAEQLLPDIEYLYRLLDVKLSRSMIVAGEWLPETGLRPKPEGESGNDKEQEKPSGSQACNAALDGSGLMFLTSVCSAFYIVLKRRKQI